MKSSERQTNCIVCNKLVSAEKMKNHIAQMARSERISNLQQPKLHNNYLISNNKIVMKEKIPNMDIKLKSKWLNSRGGRTLNDVLQDKSGYYVLMSNGKGGNVKVYMPSNQEIIKSLNLNKEDVSK
jgi:hypothetical protein